jgi:hypothetical protein
MEARMTIIAAIGVDTYPAIFGDLLVSDAELPAVPVLDEKTSVFSTAPSASSPGFDQKLVLLGDNCVVAWTGNAEFARVVARELRAIASEAPMSMEIINGYLSRLDPAMKDEIILVGWVRENGVFHQFWYRADIAESALFGRVSAGGSGAIAFLGLASQVAGGTWNVPGRALTGLERAVSSMLSATSLLLNAELSNQSDPLQFFARGYEIATFVRDRFAKVGDLAFVFWNVDATDNRIELGAPELVMKQDYAGESLLLQVLRMRPGESPASLPVMEAAKRVIPAFGGAVDTVDGAQATDFSWPGMEATFTCHVVLVRSGTDPVVFNRIDYSESRTPRSIRYVSDGSDTRFDVSQQFREELAQSIRAGLADR